MSTPVHQFMLPELPPHRWDGQVLLSTKTLHITPHPTPHTHTHTIYLNCLSQVTSSPLYSVWCLRMSGRRDGPEPRIGINHFTSERGEMQRRQWGLSCKEDRGEAQDWDGTLGKEWGQLKWGWRKVNNGRGVVRVRVNLQYETGLEKRKARIWM